MANYQVLFNGEVAERSSVASVRENLARELGLDERKARQLFSGRTVVIRSQLDQDDAEAWANKLASLGAICRIKNLAPHAADPGFRGDKHQRTSNEQTLRDITAAHLECPRCGHMQLDSTNCARCGVDLEAALRAKRKEDLMIEKKIRELRAQRESATPSTEQMSTRNKQRASAETGKKGMLRWFKR